MRVGKAANAALGTTVAECRQLVDDMVHTRARSRARAAAQHARRLRPAAGARMAGARLHTPLQRAGRARRVRLTRRSRRSASDLRLPHRPGSAHQLRAPRAGDAHQRRSSAPERRRAVESRSSDNGVGTRSAAPGHRVRVARDRGARARARRQSAVEQRGRARARRSPSACRCCAEVALARAAG